MEDERMDEDLAAFKLIQHYAMLGEGTWDDFQHRIAALRIIGTKLDLCRKLEQQLKDASPIQKEVLEDFESVTSVED